MAYNQPGSLVTTLTAGSGNWSANARTTWVKVFAWSGGAGGGSGTKGLSTNSIGGGAGGAGSFSIIEGPISAFTGPISYVVAAGASGGAAQSTDASLGLVGTAGNPTTFGNIACTGGNFGSGNGPAGSPGLTVTNLTAFTNPNLSGAGALVAATAAPAGFAYSQPTGGGGGGGGNTATARAGAAGGGLEQATGPFTIAAALGGIETGTINGANGNAAVTAGGVYSGGMGGAGGGGAKSGATGGSGGNGSVPGGGGGGGGGGINTQAPSGAGGNGAAGLIIILETF